MALRRLLAVVPTAAAVLSLCSCSSKPPYALVPVQGTVTQGGKPAPGVVVTFLPEGAGEVGPPSSGVTDAAGRYRLRASDSAEGAAVGTHRVCLITAPPPPGQLSASAGGAPDKVAARKLMPPASNRPRIPPELSRAESTPLRAEVKAGGTDIDFQVP